MKELRTSKVANSNVAIVANEHITRLDVVVNYA